MLLALNSCKKEKDKRQPAKEKTAFERPVYRCLQTLNMHSSMKEWRSWKHFWGKFNFLGGYLNELPTPDFNVKIVFYEK